MAKRRKLTAVRDVPSGKLKKKKKFEWSKFLASMIAGLFGVYGIWAGIRYYQLTELAINSQSVVMPDATLPVTCTTTVISALVSYLLYQAGLKNSRNKYGIGDDGEPYKKKNNPDDAAG